MKFTVYLALLATITASDIADSYEQKIDDTVK